MAMRETAPAPAPSAAVVGNAFVELYYHILHKLPRLVHRFYQDSSLLSRPDTNGLMTTVTTMQAINDKILSLNYKDYTAEIQTVHAQESYMNGLIVLVTGCLTGKDNVKKKFTQTFFLAPQDKGYFVLNDVFIFVGENKPIPNNSALSKGISENAPPTALTAESGWDVVEPAEGHSIFVKKLPFNATVVQLEEAFKKFGPIKRGGIQFKSNEASPINIWDHQAIVEEKRTSTRDQKMDDTCAVCADTLEWVAYGPCLHKEVCSTCIIRLRLICNDYHCCICKSESNTIFVTKALGDYTTMISDFKGLGGVNGKEGKVGEYWYHEGTKAYFDDFDHYKMIKATCKLSCNVCNKKDGRSKEFNSVEQLKGHLFDRHRLFMCSLCLEGRKIFISEQKLYNREQLTQHVRTGDSVVDGSESERGGFTGHPMCEFCENPFYGDNELYLHMSTEHFTCHICQRQHPGQYGYFNNYDNLEIHFRQEHFLCKDEACLAKKFVVFAIESELKRHNATEHGRRMSRSKRNAVLQIPTSFRFRQINEHDQHGGGHGSHSNSSGYQMNMAIEDSCQTANAERSSDISSNAQTVSTYREEREIDVIVNSFESLATIDSEPPTGYRHVSGQNSRSVPMEEMSFPPLPMAPSSSQQRSRNGLGESSGNTMAACLCRQNMVKVLNSSQALPAANIHPNSLASLTYQSRHTSDSGVLSSSSSLSSSSQSKLATIKESVLSTHTSSAQAGPSRANGLVVSSNFASSSRTSNSNSKVSQATVAPDHVDRTSHRSLSSVPYMSAAQVDNMSTSASPLLKVEDFKSSNKALVEKIRVALEFNEEKLSAFKIISTEYRRDIINTAEYLAYVHQFGLSHLVLELARLCPNAEKQRELVEIYNCNVGRNGSVENGLSIDNGRCKSKKSSEKDRERCDNNGITSSENILSDSLKVGILPKEGHHGGKGKSKILVDEQANLNLSMEPKSVNVAQPAGVSSKKNVGAGGGGNKSRKKTSKVP